MRHGSDAAPSSGPIGDRAGAERLEAEILAAMAELQVVLEAETAGVRAGRLREGLAQQERKAELASAYLRGLETVKTNAIALARSAPETVIRLREAHVRFARAVEANQAVLATARAVSEGLIKGMAEEVGPGARPQGYAPAGSQAARPSARGPVLLSRTL